jgi:hypothetical protein
MLRDIGDALAIDPDLPSIAQRIEVLLTSSEHGLPSPTPGSLPGET